MAPTAIWIADRRLYLTRDGRAVEDGDPERATLLVPAGGKLPMARARALGLVIDPPATEPGGKPAPQNKRRPGPATKNEA